MNEVKSARDVMLEHAKKTPAAPMTLVTRMVVSRTRLVGTNKYSYCPYCVKKANIMGKDWKSLLPLMKVVYKSLYRLDSDKGRIWYDEEFQCSSCKDNYDNARVITQEDFIKFYVDTNPYRERVVKLDNESIRKAGFINYGM